MCKKVMDSLLHGMVKLGVGAPSLEPQGQGTSTELQPQGTSAQLQGHGTSTQPQPQGTSTENGNPSVSIVDQVVKPHLLQVEPVKVIDAEGKLYVVYPSRPDLMFDDINIVR